MEGSGHVRGNLYGGSSNLTAIATGLNASASTIAAANAADYVVGMPTLVLMFLAPTLMKNSKKFQKFCGPILFTDEELEGDGNQKELMASEEWSIKEIAILLAISVAVVAVATKLSSFMSADFASAGRILLISTISIIVLRYRQSGSFGRDEPGIVLRA